jgi:hypothetical protein
VRLGDALDVDKCNDVALRGVLGGLKDPGNEPACRNVLERTLRSGRS